jgi:hypothetical protein
MAKFRLKSKLFVYTPQSLFPLRTDKKIGNYANWFKRALAAL